MENSDLTERLTSLSQERATFKHRLAYLERQLRRAESALTKVTMETENKPVCDGVTNTKVGRKPLLKYKSKQFYFSAFKTKNADQ